MTATNSVETNYKNYYDLYIKYATNSFEPIEDDPDGEMLLAIASLCPGMDGGSVYQARALYNTVFNYLPSYSPCIGSSERRAHSEDAEKQEGKIWDIDLYPNPTTDKITIQGNSKDDLLEIVITDLSGRILLMREVKLNGFFANLDLPLINGVYPVNISNENDERLIKKLLIAK